MSKERLCLQFLFHLLVKKTEEINDAQVDLSQRLVITLGRSMAHALQHEHRSLSWCTKIIMEVRDCWDESKHAFKGFQDRT